MWKGKTVDTWQTFDRITMLNVDKRVMLKWMKRNYRYLDVPLIAVGESILGVGYVPLWSISALDSLIPTNKNLF